MKQEGKTASFFAAIAGVLLFTGSANAALLNASFESPDASGGDVPGTADWTAFGSDAFTNSTLGPGSGPVGHAGNQSLKLFGQDSGAFQDLAASEGELWGASVWAINWAPDAFNNLAFLELSFRDVGGNLIGIPVQSFVDPIDDGTNIFLPPEDGAEVTDWTQLSVQAVAPAGTESARILLIHQLTPPAPGQGAIFFDDAKVEIVPVPAAVWLFGSGLLGMVGMTRRKKAS
jgi:hypothetical protein